MRRILWVGILTYIGIQVSIRFHYAGRWDNKEIGETTPIQINPDSTIDFPGAIIPMDTTCRVELPEIDNPEDYDLEPINDFQ